MPLDVAFADGGASTKKIVDSAPELWNWNEASREIEPDCVEFYSQVW